MKDIDKLAEEYLSNVRGMSPEKRTDHLDSIQKLYSKSKEFGDDKVQLAMQTYEMVIMFNEGRFYLYVNQSIALLVKRLCYFNNHKITIN